MIRVVIFCSRGTLARHFALIEKRNHQQDQAKDEKRDDAVEPLQKRTVVNEYLDHHKAKQGERLPAKKNGFAMNAERTQRGSVRRPKKREREMLGEAGVDPQAGLPAEIIPKLEGQGEKREKIRSDGKEAEQAALFRGDRRELFTGAQNHRGKAGDQNRIGREPFVQQELACGQRENQQSYGGDGNQ